MSEAIDQPGRCYFPDTTKITIVNRVDVLAFELRGTVRHAIEHLFGAIEEMHRAEDKIELVPMLLDPVSAGRRVNRIVIELDAGADSQIGIFVPQTIDLIEVYSGVITIVIGKRDIDQPTFARAFDPWLEQRLRVRLDPVSLRVTVVVGKKLRVNS